MAVKKVSNKTDIQKVDELIVEFEKLIKNSKAKDSVDEIAAVDEFACAYFSTIVVGLREQVMNVEKLVNTLCQQNEALEHDISVLYQLMEMDK